jgi:hypothetical protein
MGETYESVEERRPGKAVLWILLGAILIGVGILLPFANVELESGDVQATFDEDLGGLDLDTGKLYLGIAIGLVILAIVALTKAAFLSRLLLIITLVAGAFTVTASFIDIADLEDKAFDKLDEETTVDIPEEDLDVGSGVGLYVVLAGGALVVLGSLGGLFTRRNVKVQESSSDDRD